ncbi:MAG: dockerin type I domain-containing protein [Nanoarchaeota archaeon]|nr:dockerin type I domain-containing protein [Nanoarchaeota archaeon]
MKFKIFFLVLFLIFVQQAHGGVDLQPRRRVPAVRTAPSDSVGIVDTPDKREKTTFVCEGANNDNYFEVALQRLQKDKYDRDKKWWSNFAVIQMSPSKLNLVNERKIEGISAENDVTLQAIGGKNKNTPCVPIDTFSLTLSDCHKINGKTGKALPCLANNKGKSLKIQGGVNIGGRSIGADIGAGVSLFDPTLSTDVEGASLYSLLPTVSKPTSGEGSSVYRFDYVVSASGKRSNDSIDEETRDFFLYVIVSDVEFDKYKNTEEKEKDLSSDINVIISTADKIVIGASLGIDVRDDVILLQNLFGEKAFPAACPADINGDGVIDIVDLIVLADAFGASSDYRYAGKKLDINGDGSIDIMDLVKVGQRFGERCPVAGANSGNNVALSFDSAQDKLAQGITGGGQTSSPTRGFFASVLDVLWAFR